MRRLLHALFACVLLVAGLGVGLGAGSNALPEPPPHACCGGMMPTPAPAGCPCPQAPAPSPLPGLAPAPLAAPVQVEALTDGAADREASARPRFTFVARPAPGAAPRLASGDGPARAPALHQRLALLRCWRT